MKKDFIIVLGFALMAVLLVSCSSSSEKGGGGSNKTNLTSLSVMDIDGNTHSFGEYVGQKPLIINFWGTWCPPCKREMPDIKRIYDEYRDRGLEIIGLAVRSTPEQVKAYTSQFGYDWVMWMADANNAKALGIGSGVPYTVFIDRNGNILNETFTGWRTYDDFKRMVEKII
ncbi:MAG TPA: TlpA family protein disulfide reductase [candidate division Zixibacteria bacterium]|nr:TlpA family protein disulfide reductase [candidate division Zixibacteria bacterium]